MTRIDVEIDGSPLEPGYVDGDRILVPLESFCQAVGAKIKMLDGLDSAAVCRGDLCIQLNAGEAVDTKHIERIEYVYVDLLKDALNLHIQQAGEVTMIATTEAKRGLNPGDMPPEFTLPDLYSGDPVTSSTFLGRKTVFYMWASW